MILQVLFTIITRNDFNLYNFTGLIEKYGFTSSIHINR